MFIQNKPSVSSLGVERRHWTLAEVVFGSPKKNCAGVGICSMNPLIQEPTNYAFPCQKVIAQLMVEKQQLLLLRLSKQGLCPHLAMRQFPKNKFILKTNFKLPASICARLNIQKDLIPAGTYSVEENEESYCICMALV
ncbi:MAG: hypothetical protein DHS20C18_18130 [Saprospiraceae bacterium]|nr:MAG: hypothetical protein DHS20C18_18130 [Saprospiraceae bacterium]